MKLCIPILATTVILAAGCADQERNATNHEPAETTSAAQTSGTTVTLSQEDKQFMTEAATGGMFEVMLGQQIQRKATSPDVRDFAAMMVRDHTQANDELKSIAERKGFELPTQLDEHHRTDIDELTRLSGPELDRKYIDAMVTDHVDDVQKFRAASQTASDPEIRSWAAKTLRVLDGHLARAKDLQARLHG